MPDDGGVAIVDGIGISTLVFVVLLLLIGSSCGIFVVYFHLKIHKEKLLPLHRFNALWIVRICLIVFAILSAVLQLLRTPIIQRWLLIDGLHVDATWQDHVCRIYVVLGSGFSEPCFFLSALFLVRGSLREVPIPSHTPSKELSKRLVILTLLFSLPVFMAQLAIVLSDNSDHEEYVEMQGGLPRYFLRSSETYPPHRIVNDDINGGGGSSSSSPAESGIGGGGGGGGIGGENGGRGRERRRVCAQPLLSTLTLSLFALVYLVYFFTICWKMASLIINKKLQTRLYLLQGVFTVAWPVRLFLLGGCSKLIPGSVEFEGEIFVSILLLGVCTVMGEVILVLWPTWDAFIVSNILKLSKKKRKPRGAGGGGGGGVGGRRMRGGGGGRDHVGWIFSSDDNDEEEEESMGGTGMLLPRSQDCRSMDSDVATESAVIGERKIHCLLSPRGALFRMGARVLCLPKGVVTTTSSSSSTPTSSSLRSGSRGFGGGG